MILLDHALNNHALAAAAPPQAGFADAARVSHDAAATHMQLSPPPDLSSNRRLVIAALVVTLLASAGLIWHTGSLATKLGDTDDAMRLVLVRDLMAGRGWYDQLVMRLGPPHGTYMHWSRLLDAALAFVMRLFGLFLSPAAAETATRFFWPLAWIIPTLIAALVMTRRLGGRAALFVAAVLFASNQQPFVEFIPGRVDHHNIQIAMTVIAAACAMARDDRARLAVVAALSTAFGLAIGIEALPFHAIIGASYALRAATGHDDARTSRNYAVTLAGAILFLFCLQTPPWRWSLSFCDEIGLNLVATIVVASAGLLAVTYVGGRLSARVRITMLGTTALATAAVYLTLDPACIKGPLASIDPRIRPFWFDQVVELKPLTRILKEYFDVGVALIVMSLLTAASGAWLIAREWPRPRAATLLSCALAFVAIVGGIGAFREVNYVLWFGFPLLATGMSLAAERLWRGVMVPTVAAAVLLSPVGVGTLVRLGEAAVVHSPRTAVATKRASLCADTVVYKPLAALPAGLVLADISMGPFILANTHDSVAAAPYHRMVSGILAGHAALTGPSAEAEERFRALNVDYLVECPTNPVQVTRGSIEDDLARGNVPPWLEPLSRPADALQIYRVRASPSG